MILKFVVDFIDGQAVFLDGKETSVLMSFCLRLLQIYSSHNIGKVRTGILIAVLFRVRIFLQMLLLMILVLKHIRLHV
jgi:hypothetical protein